MRPRSLRQLASQPTTPDYGTALRDEAAKSFDHFWRLGCCLTEVAPEISHAILALLGPDFSATC